MLTSLRIKNVALAADLTLDLQSGYNVITGETGAGKSIVIGALSLILGERADRTLIRTGSESSSVEGVFELNENFPAITSLLEANGLEPCEEGQLLLKRTLSATGTNRQFVNGSPASLGVLAQIGDKLVDMHGPYEHQSLLDPSRQLEILDAFGKLQPLRAEFATLVSQRAAVEKRKNELVVDEEAYRHQIDLLQFQVREIESAHLNASEETDLENEHRRAANAARLLELTQNAMLLLTEDEAALTIQCGALGRILHDVQKLDPGAEPLSQLQAEISAGLGELQTCLRQYADRVDVDPARLKKLDDRLTVIQGLKRKYGKSVQEVIAFGAAARERLAQLENSDAQLSALNAEKEQIEKMIVTLGNQLSQRRRKLLPKLVKAITAELRELGFPTAAFDITLETTDGRTTSMVAMGFDAVEFQFAPNVGEAPRPLRAIASSGEIARVMLAIKTVLAAEDEIPLLVFDEVDANVGGETARAVGCKMGEIARQRQVICITHLAPVAAAAHAHFVVTKVLREGRTISEIHLLDASARVVELARMLGGQGEAERRHAEALLARA